MYSEVIPGRHHFAVLGLGRVKRRADIAFGTGKDHQGFAAILQLAPLRISLGEVPVERAIRAFVGVEQQRQVAGLQALFAQGHQLRQAGVLDQLLQFRQIFESKGAWCVHEIFLGECLHPRQANGSL